MITKLVRFTYANVWEAKPDQNGRMKFSTGMLIDKKDTACVAELRAEIDKAIAKGVAGGKFTAALTKLPKFKHPLRDGDAFYEEQPGPDREAYRGNWFMNASNTDPIGVADRFGRPLFDRDEFYSGCYGHADIRFFPFNTNGNAGIGVGLNNVMKKIDGDRLDGRQSAAVAFSSVADSEDDSSAPMGSSDLT